MPNDYATTVKATGLVVPAELDEAGKDVFAWLRLERDYQAAKFGLEADSANIQNPEWLSQQMGSYLSRIPLFTLETPQGRQAFAKLAATLVGLTEAAVRVYGPLPTPGVPSGEISEWTREG